MKRLPVASLVLLLLVGSIARAEDEIRGMGIFGGSPRAREILEDRGFVVTDETRRQIISFYILEPRVFVTTDVVLHVYFANVEENLRKLMAAQESSLVRWIDTMRARLEKSLATRSAHSAEWDRAVSAVDEYLLVAHALSRGQDPDFRAPDRVREEIRRIRKAGASGPSPLRKVVLDYRRFRPSGLTAGLPNFHRAVTWLHDVPFRLSSEHETRQALLLVALQPTAPDAPGAGAISGPFTAFLGHSDDLGLREYGEALPGPAERASPWTLGDDGLRRVTETLAQQPSPRMPTTPTRDAIRNPAVTKGLRLLPRPLLFDNEVFRHLTPFGLERPPVTGEELFAAMGGPTARRIVEGREGRSIPGHGDLLAKAERAAVAAENAFSAPIDRARRAVLRTLIDPVVDETAPGYFRHPRWRIKDLGTALAGWAHHRYVWDLHAKRHSFFGGSGAGPKGVVEPNEPFFAALSELTRLTATVFERHGVADHRFGDLEDLVGDLREILVRRRTGAALEERLVAVLSGIGPRLGHLCGFPGNSWLVDGNLPDQSFATPVSHDLYSNRERWVGQARPRAIYVVVEHEGGRWLMRGGVLSYRDHVCPGTGPERMTMERWREESALDRHPAPAWQEPLYVQHTTEELLDRIRAGEIVPVLSRRLEPEIGDLLAERIAAGERFRFRGDERPSDRAHREAIRLLVDRDHPRLVAVLFPRVVDPAGAKSRRRAMWEWPEAAALEGRLDASHLPLLLRAVEEGHRSGPVLMELVASIRTEAAESAVLSWLESHLTGAVLDALLEHGGVRAARRVLALYDQKLEGLLDRRDLETIVALQDSLLEAWPAPGSTIAGPLRRQVRSPEDYSEEERVFAEALRKRFVRR